MRAICIAPVSRLMEADESCRLNLFVPCSMRSKAQNGFPDRECGSHPAAATGDANEIPVRSSWSRRDHIAHGVSHKHCPGNGPTAHAVVSQFAPVAARGNARSVVRNLNARQTTGFFPSNVKSSHALFKLHIPLTVAAIRQTVGLSYGISATCRSLAARVA